MPLPWSQETELLNRKTAALDQWQTGYGLDQATFQRLLDINQNWPDIRPGVALSFARSGVGADHPAVRDAARLSIKQTLSQQEWKKTLKGLKTVKDLHNLPQGFVDSLNHHQLKQLHKRGNQIVGGLLDGGTFSDVTSAVGDAFAGANSAVENATGIDVGGALKTGTREAGAVAMVPLQFGQGEVRNVVHDVGRLVEGEMPNSQQNPGATAPYQTDFGQQLNAATTGGDTSLGGGWLPDPQSPSAQAAARAARASAPTIAGHAFTIGRATAYIAGQTINPIFNTHLIQPGSNAYNALSGTVDAVVAFKGDPMNRVLTDLGDARQAGKVFNPELVPEANRITETTGLAPLAQPRDVIQGTKSAWLNSPQAESGLTRIAESSNPSEILRITKGGVNAETAVQLADAPDVSAVRSVFSATTLPERPTIGGFNYQARRVLDSRLLSAMPGHQLVDLADKNMTWPQIESTLLSANVPRETRDLVLNQYLRSTNPIEAMDSMQAALREQILHYNPIPKGLDAAGAKAYKDTIGKASSVWRKTEDMAHSYDVDQATGLERVRPGVIVAGDVHVFPHPTADSERLSSLVRFPDGRSLRQLTNRWARILRHPAVQNMEGAGDAIVNTWKSSVVARPELLTKITLEQQINAASRGYITALTHPLSFMSVLAGGNMDSRWGQFLANRLGVEPSFQFGIDAQPIMEESNNLLQRSLRYHGQDPETLTTVGFHNAHITHPEAGRGLAESIGRMYADPIFRGVAKADTPEAAKEWFWSGEGKDLRLARAEIVAEDDAHNLAKVASGKAGPDAQAVIIGDIANDRAAADRYIDLAHVPRLNDLTNGNQELLDAVRTGKLGGRDIYQLWDPHAVVDQKAADYAKALLDSGEGPRNMVPIRDVADINLPKTGWYSRAMDHVFHYMIDAPNKILNASPVFRQAYWNRTAELLPYIEPGELEKALTNARNDNLPEALLRRIEGTVLDGTDTPRLSLADISKTSKAVALGGDLPKVVHDLTSRTHFFDTLRWLVPFGDAWRLVMVRAAKLVAEEPQILQRANLGIYEAKQPGSNTINRLAGDPVDPNNGFFHTDPLTGQGVFTIPGSSALTKATFGVPVPLVGQVKGLSMLSDAYPSLGGPGLSLAAKWLIPDTPTGTKIKEFLFPKSSSDSLDPVTDIAQTFAPSWFTKLIHAYPNQHTFNSAFNSALQQLSSTGDYDLNKPDDLKRLIHDAKSNAGWIYTLRGAAQFFLPGAPTDDALIKDKTGHWAEAQVAIKAYQDKAHTIGYDKATKWVLDTWGVNNIFLTQAASQPTAYAVPVTKSGLAWLEAHPGVRDDYPLTHGLFVPAKKGEKFDPNAYGKQYDNAERVSLSPAQQIAQAENRLGFYAYDRAKAKVVQANGGRAPDKPQQKWLSDYRAVLKKAFPGFDTYTASPYDTRARRTQAIDELQKAAKDSALTSTDAGAGMVQYLALRQRAIDQAVAGGGKTPFQAKAGQALRMWLRAQAARIIQVHPGFQPMWNDVFSREMVDN